MAGVRSTATAIPRRSRASPPVTRGSVKAQNKYAEEAHRGVIQCYVRLHDYSQATEYYNLLRAMFEDELGVAPAPETRAALQPTAVSTSVST